jgi:glycerol-3-phosphate acyltransferase PlsX
VVAVDANGADGGPELVAEGARRSGIDVLLFGPAARMGVSPPSGRAELIDAPEGIDNSAEPARAVRSAPDASVVQAARAVASGRADALVSAGSTGATLAAGLFHVGRLRGVHRPAVAVLLPVPGRPTLLLDAGAGVEARPEHLVQFALMGAAFMSAAHGVVRPRVGLVSNGEEAEKGPEAVVEAHRRLAGLGPGGAGLEFVGNVEGGDLTAGRADVVVTDGFTGNVALKLMEGTARTVVGAVRAAIRSTPLSALGGLLVRGSLAGLRDQLDPNAVGGAILLGLRSVAVVAHGGASADGISAAVRLARRAADERTVERTAASLEAAGALRSAPAGTFGP